MADTANYGWTKPTVSADSNTWGTINNTAWDDADASVKAVADAAAAATATANASMLGLLEDSGSISVATSALDVTLPTGYRAFKLIIVQAYPASDAKAYLRFNYGAGVISGASDYYWIMSGSGINVADDADSEIELTYNTVESAGATGTRFEIDILVPTDPETDLTTVDFSSSYRNFGAAEERVMGRASVLTKTTRPTAVRFLFNGVNISRARWALYGVNGL
jgi:hypothetical protein